MKSAGDLATLTWAHRRGRRPGRGASHLDTRAAPRGGAGVRGVTRGIRRRSRSERPVLTGSFAAGSAPLRGAGNQRAGPLGRRRPDGAPTGGRVRAGTASRIRTSRRSANGATGSIGRPCRAGSPARPAGGRAAKRTRSRTKPPQAPRPHPRPDSTQRPPSSRGPTTFPHPLEDSDVSVHFWFLGQEPQIRIPVPGRSVPLVGSGTRSSWRSVA